MMLFRGGSEKSVLLVVMLDYRFVFVGRCSDITDSSTTGEYHSLNV
jgi:hypothetical protein